MAIIAGKFKSYLSRYRTRNVPAPLCNIIPNFFINIIFPHFMFWEYTLFGGFCIFHTVNCPDKITIRQADTTYLTYPPLLLASFVRQNVYIYKRGLTQTFL